LTAQTSTPTPEPTGAEYYAFPMSYAQERLWFLDRLEPESTSYHVPLLLRLRGELDNAALERAFAALVERHDTLRTVFLEEDGAPVQAVWPSWPVRLDLQDCSTAEDAEAEALGLVAEIVARRFDLAAAPAFRAVLIRVAPRMHLLAVVLHHIVCDAWSTSVLMRELGALYTAYQQGADPALPELEIQYPDFTLWQRELLKGERLEAEIEHWRARLAGAPELLELPTDHPRPSVLSDRGAHSRLELAPELLDALHELSEREGTSLFMTLLAALNVLLHRYSGQEDILVGTPIAGRPRLELEQLIGFFANTLVLRTSLEGDPTFEELLARTREATLDAYVHQELPFEQLVAELNPERVRSRTPLFQVVFTLQPATASDLTLPELELERVRIERGTSKFDLTVIAREADTGLRLTFEYSTDLFEEETVERMLTHLRLILEQAAADPARPISALQLLPQEERIRIVETWNETVVEYPQDRSIAELFEAQVDRTPDAVAIVSGEQRLPYAELDRLSNQLARHLRSLGVGPETVVAVSLDRSTEMVITLLAILKAGGAYLPLDPRNPEQRLKFMLEEAEAQLLVTKVRGLGKLPVLDLPNVCLDRDRRAIASQPDSRCEPQGSGSSLAYILFTSGSTGTPKGVAVEQRSISRLVFAQWYMQFGPDRRFMQFAPLAFDASTLELWGPLLHGGTCVIGPQTVPNARELGEAIRAGGVDSMFITTSLFNAVVDEDPSALAPLKWLMTGGEAVSVSHVRRAAEALPETQIVHCYGPTECTTFSCCYLVPRDFDWNMTIPIGMPIANTTAYVLDAKMEPVPVGIPGELHIGGPGLARGYVKRPDLTAERFVPSPFAEGERLYTTGDLVRWREDGTIEFLGRRDEQVKLRGFRIELTEIEQALEQHAAVQRAVVILNRREDGDNRLIAFVLPANGTQASPKTLREFVGGSLPDYMVPSAFVTVAELPLTSSGKVDRNALRRMEPDDGGEHETAAAEYGAAWKAPRDSWEQAMAAIWSKLLRVEKVGAHDDFFDLGGHSLLAVKLFSEIERTFGVRLPLAMLFEGATVADLAEAVRAEQPEQWNALVRLRPGTESPPLFLVSMLTGEVLGYRSLVGHLSPERPVYGFQAIGLDGRTYPLTRIDEIAARYATEMRELQPRGPYLIAGFCSGGVVAYEMARRLREEGEETAFLGLIDSSPTTGRTRGRLTRPSLRSFLMGQPDSRREAFSKLAAWLAKETRRETRWAVFHLLVALHLPLPKRLRDVEVAFRRAMDKYVTPPTELSVTVFRATAKVPDTPSSSHWQGFAHGGVDIRPVVGEGITHNAMTLEPYVGTLAAALETAVDEAAAGLEAPDGSRPRVGA
jgi:aspartate racemase